jgi:tRNA(Ile)-lysidine synthase
VSGSPLDRLRGEPALLLAVSGGPDSTALLAMAAEWGGAPLHAATVDHGLRPEAEAEAEAVASLCTRLAVPHATLVWQGEKPTARLQERAREARYDLLTAEAKRVGAGVIVTAHHLDDQAETVLFRLLRGSGVAGLAGMAARTRRGEIEIARPLLGLAKADLVAFCDARRLPYFRDPSNENPRFARARLRRLMADEGLDAPALARLARRAALAETALAAQAHAAEARLGLASTGRCEAAALAAEPEEIVRRVLTRAVGPAPFEAMERIAAELLTAVAERRRYAANVGGALIAYDGRGSVSVGAEPPRRSGAADRRGGGASCQQDAGDDQSEPGPGGDGDRLAEDDGAEQQADEGHDVIVERGESRPHAQHQREIK